MGERWYRPFGWKKPKTAEEWAREMGSDLYAPKSEQEYFEKVLRTFEEQIRLEYEQREEETSEEVLF